MGIGDQAKELYLSGFSCGEAVAKAIMDSGLVSMSSDAVKACSAFKTGIGAIKRDLCGSLLAGLVVVGVKYGRDNAGDDIAEVNRRSAQLYDRFQQHFATLHCSQLTKAFPVEDKEVFASKERKALCAEVVKFVTQELADNVL